MTPTFHFRLPETFHPGEFLRLPRLRYCHDDARYFISLILTKLARRDVDESGVVRLMAKHLRSVMHFDHYKPVVEALLAGGAVTRVPYQVGERPFGYVLADRFHDDRHVRIPATDPRLIRRLDAYHQQAEQERRARMKPVHAALERMQWQLRIDGNLAREIIAGLPPASNPFDVQGILVSDIEHRNFRVNVGRYGRLTNNITSMKRELRAALRAGDQPLQQVDIGCCQPAFVGQAATEAGDRATRGTGRTPEREDTGTSSSSIYDAGNGIPHKSDLEHYCQLVQSGEFYEFMAQELRIGLYSNLTRDELKHRFLCDVIAKRKANRRGVEYPSKVEDCFRQHFPSVYQFIRRFNRNGYEHSNLIRELQRRESKLVIETVAADLLARCPRLFIITLHDAIYTQPHGIPEVLRAFNSAFERINFPMMLKVEA